MANPIDLVTTAQVKSWIGVTTSADDANIQACITMASWEWLRRTGRGPADGSVPSASPLVSPVAYNENYDGPGGVRLFLRNTPIVSIEVLTIGTQTIQQSAVYGQPGWVIDSGGKSIALRNGGGGGNSSFTVDFYPTAIPMAYFFKAIQNVNVQYHAGFQGVPPDIYQRTIQMVALNYKRKDWIDLKSRAMAQGAGTVTYMDWELPPEVLECMMQYRRLAVTG